MNIEDPSVPIDSVDLDDDQHAALLGGVTDNVSGVRVNRRRALGYSAVWRAVNLIASGVARLPLHVYRISESGDKSHAKDHPAYRLLRRKPNDCMTAYIFRSALQAHALTEGNGYAYVKRDPAHRPIELMLLDPGSTWPVRVNGDLWYVTYAPPKTTNGRREMLKIPSPDMIHIRGLGFDGLTGYPVLSLHKETIGKALAGRDYGTRYFSNSARPGFALECPSGMKPTAIENLRNGWERLHRGVNNAHRVGILREGVKLVAYDTNAKNAQLIENLAFDSREIANLFGVPAHKLGDPSKVAYNSLESENQSFLDDTLDGWLITHEEEYYEKLLTEDEKAQETHEILFQRSRVSRAPLSARGAYYSQAILGGWMNRDEVRQEEGRNAIPEGAGASFTLPVNVQTIDDQEPEPEPEPEPVQEPAPTPIPDEENE